MAATAQNHMEPLHGDEKKHDEYEYEDERMCPMISTLLPRSFSGCISLTNVPVDAYTLVFVQLNSLHFME